MKHLWQAIMLVRQCDRWAFWRRLLYVLLQSVLPLLNVYILKLLIDLVQSSSLQPVSWPAIMQCLGIMCVVFLANRVVGSLASVNHEVLSQRLIDYVSDLMQRQAARLDMAYYDNPSYHDTLHRAQLEANYRPIQVFNSAMTLMGATVSLLGVGLMLASTSWWVIVVMVVAVLPTFLLRLRKAKAIYAFRRQNTQLYRRTSYYGNLLTHRDSAKEIRAFRLTDFFRQRYVEARQRLSSQLLRISRRLGIADILCAVVEAVAMFSVVAMLLRQTYSQAITIGTFVMLFEAFRRGQNYLGAFVGAVANLYDNRLFVSNLFDFLGLEPQVVAPAQPMAMPDEVEEVEFRDVSFLYPGTDHQVLHHFNLKAHRGSIVRIEGENGFGKSTIVKLMLRLYDPDSGCILVNGIDIRRFDPTDLRAHIGTLFQDFVRYNCTVAENLQFGASAHPVAAADEGSLLHFLDRLPQGEQSLLGRLFEGGNELSMGQWQRLSIARVLRGGAPIMLFDEPMAWLDESSRKTFSQCLHQASTNRIIILINHI